MIIMMALMWIEVSDDLIMLYVTALTCSVMIRK